MKMHFNGTLALIVHHQDGFASRAGNARNINLFNKLLMLNTTKTQAKELHDIIPTC